MDFKKIFCILFTLIFVFGVYVYLLIFSTWKVKYDLTDCVRYFDDQGRYRLMLVGNSYFFVDAKKEYGQKSNIIQYYFDREIFYGISFVNNKKLYFLFNIKTGEQKETFDVNMLSKNEIHIFDSPSMIKLNPPGKYERFYRKFIPLKYRKK